MKQPQEATSENPYEVTGDSLPGPIGRHTFPWAKLLLGGLAWTIFWLAGTILLLKTNLSDTFIHFGVDGDDGPTAVFLTIPSLWAVVLPLSMLPIGWLLILLAFVRAAALRRSKVR